MEMRARVRFRVSTLKFVLSFGMQSPFRISGHFSGLYVSGVSDGFHAFGFRILGFDLRVSGS